LLFLLQPNCAVVYDWFMGALSRSATAVVLVEMEQLRARVEELERVGRRVVVADMYDHDLAPAICDLAKAVGMDGGNS
jgi:hypothetical protein